MWRKYAVSRELFQTRRLVARAAGLLWGSYHLARPRQPGGSGESLPRLCRPQGRRDDDPRSRGYRSRKVHVAGRRSDIRGPCQGEDRPLSGSLYQSQHRPLHRCLPQRLSGAGAPAYLVCAIQARREGRVSDGKLGQLPDVAVLIGTELQQTPLPLPRSRHPHRYRCQRRAYEPRGACESVGARQPSASSRARSAAHPCEDRDGAARKARPRPRRLPYRLRWTSVSPPRYRRTKWSAPVATSDEAPRKKDPASCRDEATRGRSAVRIRRRPRALPDRPAGD